ncbi:hypothetical protein AAVH_37307, partial [Aphelenchoides avenae]
MPLLYTFGAGLIGSQVYSILYRVTLVLSDPRIKHLWLSLKCVTPMLLLIMGVAAVIGALMYTKIFNVNDIALATAQGYVHVEELHLEWLKNFTLISDVDTAIFCISVDRGSILINLGIVILFAIAETLSICMGVWIIRTVKKSSLSARTKQLHLQLTRLIVAQ